MDSGIKVGDIMTRNFVAVRPETSLFECSKEMVKNKVGSLVIKNDQKIHGILTEGDIISAIVRRKNSDITTIQARDIAAKKLTTVKPEEDIIQALTKMRKSYHKRLPVIANGNIVGMITIKDILRLKPDLFSEIHGALKIKEEMEKMKRIEDIRGLKVSGEGRCEECGNLEMLYRNNGILLCENCLP